LMVCCIPAGDGFEPNQCRIMQQTLCFSFVGG
jgi:hypothetical protein